MATKQTDAMLHSRDLEPFSEGQCKIRSVFLRPQKAGITVIR